MMYYRFYLRNAVGHIVAREHCYCADEAEARVRARELSKGHDIEIWQGTTKVGLMELHRDFVFGRAGSGSFQLSPQE
jgi:hypothetical protein